MATDTRERILSKAIDFASRDGLGAITIGTLATSLEMSKSGLIAHFGSKEELQSAVVRETAERFATQVVIPALRAARGEPRVRALFERWVAWAHAQDRTGGCILLAASSEFDDHPGPLRDLVALTHRQLAQTIEKAARVAVDAGDFRADLDCEQFAFELRCLIFGYHHTRRLLDDVKADAHVTAAFDRLIQAARKPTRH